MYQEVTRLDRLNLVGEMAASISHEIRNPMTTVRGYLQLLAVKQEFIDYQEQLQLMIEELDRANVIITEFLSLARKKSINKKQHNLNRVVESMLPLIEADAIKDDKNLVVDLAATPDLLMDESEVRQLLLNMVRNGLEAMPPGGKLFVKTYKDNGQVVLAVSNKGPAIPEEIRVKLGTPFFTTKVNGTGLGLATCYWIAERHNAKIEIKTGDEETTFNIRFNI